MKRIGIFLRVLSLLYIGFSVFGGKVKTRKIVQSDTLDSFNLKESSGSNIRKIHLGNISFSYYLDSCFHLKDYWEDIDNMTFIEYKSNSSNILDTSLLISSLNNILSIPTDLGHIIYEIKPAEIHAHKFEDYEHIGYYESLDAHVVSFQNSGRLGFDLILTSCGTVMCFYEFPYPSNDNKFIISFSTERDNATLSIIKFYLLGQDIPELLWAGWSDHSILPTEAVWESDSTVLIEAKEFSNRENFYENKEARIIYGRLTVCKKDTPCNADY
ncbi:MAG: hypothetical protein ACK5MG_06160 [Bacteroidales bacterium]